MVYGNISEQRIQDINWILEITSYLEQDTYNYGLESLNEKFNPSTGEGGKYRPVFVVLTHRDTLFDKTAHMIKPDSKYWHVSLAFTPELSKCYSFNIGHKETAMNKRGNGLSCEPINYYKKIHPEGDLYVGCVFLDETRFKQLKETLNYYIKNKEKSKYDLPRLIGMMTNKSYLNGRKANLQVCSTFVDDVLKSAGVKFSNKDTGLVLPDDLKATDKEKQFKIYDGKIGDYDPDKAAKVVESMVDSDEYYYFFTGKKKK